MLSLLDTPYFLAWAVAIFLTVILVTLIGNELYLLLYKKKDRGFWKGSFVLFQIYAFGWLTCYSYDLIQYLNFNSSIENAHVGELNKDYLKTLYADSLYDIGCTGEDTDKSRQCIFIMGAESNDDVMVSFISNDEKASLRYGSWPFANTMTFPSVFARQKAIDEQAGAIPHK